MDREIRFTADVTHELRSPLAAIRAAVDVLQRRRGALSPDAPNVLDVLSQRVTGFERTVVDLLDIARTDAGTAELRPEPIELRTFVEELVGEHAPAATLVVDEGVPARVRADRRRLAQSLVNVMENAAAYAGGTTRVEVECLSDGGLRLTLDDEGPGVPPEEREAIFGRFNRGSAGIDAGASTGTGLGLAIVDEHVRLHGGRVHVEAAPGGGARFVFELPGARP